MPNVLDITILVVLALAFAGGWQLGFLTRATSWLGLAGGLLLGARGLPWLVERLEGASSARVLFTVGMVLFAVGSTGLLVGLLIGNRLRSVVSGEQVRMPDRIAGGAASCVGVVFVVWLLVPLMADIPQWPAQQARGSLIVQSVDAVLPTPPDSIQALSRLVGEDRFPRVLDALDPSPRIVDPPAETGLPDEVTASVLPSVVRVDGVACRRVQSGSGFVVADDLVVTNAHVVAGEPTTGVTRDDGTTLPATVVAFDPERDLAVLRVPGLDRSPLGLRPGEVGELGAVFGYPGGGELRVAPFEVARHLTATGRDIYYERRTSRDVFVVAAHLAGGDSGAALVGADGSVIAVAFAVAPDRDAVAYALTTAEISAVLDQPLDQGVDTGGCLG
ncbi:MAG: MarP family serine protease [Acidimicrobiales bacterium]